MLKELHFSFLVYNYKIFLDNGKGFSILLGLENVRISAKSWPGKVMSYE